MAEPYCLAMILCDGVHVDSTTGKQTILGTFSTVGAPTYPAKVRLCVYFAITDAQGDYRLVFQIVDSGHAFDDQSTPIVSLEMDAHSPSPLAVCEGFFGGDTELPKPGVYHCELIADGNLIMSRRLVALGNQEEIKG